MCFYFEAETHRDPAKEPGEAPMSQIWTNFQAQGTLIAQCHRSASSLERGWEVGNSHK